MSRQLRLSAAAPVARREDEDMRSWCARKSRAAGRLAKEQGLWSVRHVARLMSWHSHLQGPRNAANHAALLLAYHDKSWRSSVRVAAGSSSSSAGRMQCRRLTHVTTRRDDSLDSIPLGLLAQSKIKQ